MNQATVADAIIIRDYLNHHNCSEHYPRAIEKGDHAITRIAELIRLSHCQCSLSTILNMINR